MNSNKEGSIVEVGVEWTDYIKDYNEYDETSTINLNENCDISNKSINNNIQKINILYDNHLRRQTIHCLTPKRVMGDSDSDLTNNINNGVVALDSKFSFSPMKPENTISGGYQSCINNSTYLTRPLTYDFNNKSFNDSINNQSKFSSTNNNDLIKKGLIMNNDNEIITDNYDLTGVNYELYNEDLFGGLSNEISDLSLNEGFIVNSVAHESQLNYNEPNSTQKNTPNKHHDNSSAKKSKRSHKRKSFLRLRSDNNENQESPSVDKKSTTKNSHKNDLNDRTRPSDSTFNTNTPRSKRNVLQDFSNFFDRAKPSLGTIMRQKSKFHKSNEPDINPVNLNFNKKSLSSMNTTTSLTPDDKFSQNSLNNDTISKNHEINDHTKKNINIIDDFIQEDVSLNRDMKIYVHLREIERLKSEVELLLLEEKLGL